MRWHDARLVPSTMAMWLATAAAVTWLDSSRSGIAGIAAGVAGICGVAIAIAGRHRHGRAGNPPTGSVRRDVARLAISGQAAATGGAASSNKSVSRGPRMRGQIVMCSLVLALTLGMTAWRADPRIGELASAGSSNDVVTLVLARVITQPRAFGGGGSASSAGWWAQIDVHGWGSRTERGELLWTAPRSVVRAVLFARGEQVQWMQWIDLAGAGIAVAGSEVTVRARQVTVVRAAPGVLAWSENVRSATLAASRSIGTSGAALVPGVAIGDTSLMPEDMKGHMRASGLTHLTAVSGAHFAIVSSCVWLLLGFARVGRRTRAVLVLIVLVGMVVLVRPEPSVVRAAGMAVIVVLGIVAGRRSSPVPALCTAMNAALLLDPTMATSVGFVLSVVATAGLVLIAPMIEGRLTRVPERLRPHLAVALSAQLVCAPVIVTLSPHLHSWSAVANILVTPVVAPLTITGACVVLTANAWPQGAEVLTRIAAWIAEWIVAVARVCASFPGAELQWLPGMAGVAAMVVLCAATAVLVVRGDAIGRFVRSELVPTLRAARVMRRHRSTMRDRGWCGPTRRGTLEG